MIIVQEIRLYDFNPWSGAVDTLDNIIELGGYAACERLEAALMEVYPEGMTETELNDILWFEPEYCYEWAGVPNPYQDDEDEEEPDEDEE